VVGLHRSGPDRKLLALALELGVAGVDTAYNYQGGASHRLLAECAGDLLDRLAISTKVGFFPNPDGTVAHSLEPARLDRAVRESASTLGVPPELVFLHNPERSLADLAPAPVANRLLAACATLRDAAAAGSCRRWGIACWSPTALLRVLDELPAREQLGPAVLMIPAGLSVSAGELNAAEQLADRLRLPRSGVWGMAPFGGDPRHPAWTPATTTPLLAPAQRCDPFQGAYRLAFELPPVARVAVGANTPARLRALLAATELRVDTERVAGYRLLLRRQALS
jgi:pyridoxine 4-dehydrogenase